MAARAVPGIPETAISMREVMKGKRALVGPPVPGARYWPRG